ncbi:MAG: universal stress protein [Deltaproteobacteria bacterium]|nr:universal stress protein [Deltaproteobacteria bacterium]
MPQRIIVGLDGTEYSKSAVQWAIRRANLFGAVIVGIAVLDVPGIEKTAVGAGLGAGYYAKRSVNSKIEDASARTREFMREFEEAALEAGVPHEIYLKMGDPVDVFMEEGKTADLIIMGLRTFFQFETTQQPDDELIRRLLKDPVCPILGVPKKIQPHRTIIIAFNGSSASARAMRLYTHISPNRPDTFTVKVLTVTDSVEEGEYLLNRAEKYLNTYGIQPEKIWRTGVPEDVIYETAIQNMPCMVVMGVYMDKRTFLFGHRTQKLMEDGTIPLLVYH